MSGNAAENLDQEELDTDLEDSEDNDQETDSEEQENSTELDSNLGENSVELSADNSEEDNTDQEDTEKEINYLDLPDDEVDDHFYDLMDQSVKDGKKDIFDGDSSKEYKEGKKNTPDKVDVDNRDTGSDTNNNNDSDISPQEQLDLLFTPFKANGKQIQVNNVQDALTLMQMGANYNKKMAGLKPNLKLMKMLENNKLLDEEKLSYLIDLDKGNPEAINKLIATHKIDPLDIEPKDDEDDSYQPGSYAVDDGEVELDAVLDSLSETPAFEDTIEIIGKWDEESKQVLVSNPQIIKIINDHVDAKIYDQIMNVVESEKMMGRLNGLSDIQAYQKVGDAMQANGQFNSPNKRGNNKQSNAKQRISSNVKQRAAATKNRKKAASPSKGSQRNTLKTDFNPLSMSDEDFDKLPLDMFN